jgi:ribosome-associated heat shock protein Hsp15
MPSEKIRIDKWLWAVRVYKTRTLAAEACKKGKVIIGGTTVKPSHEVKFGEIIFLRKLPVVYTLRVKGLTHNRLPARSVNEFYDDLTSPEELAKLKVQETVLFQRDRGTGRPTKRERRQMDEILCKEC